MFKVVRTSIKVEHNAWIEVIKRVLAGEEPFAVVSAVLGIPPEVFQWLDLDDRETFVRLSDAVQALKDFDECVAPQLAPEAVLKRRTNLADRVDRLVRVLMRP